MFCRTPSFLASCACVKPALSRAPARRFPTLFDCISFQKSVSSTGRLSDWSDVSMLTSNFFFDPINEFFNIFTLKWQLNMGLFHESQHSTPQFRFHLPETPSRQRINRKDDNDIFLLLTARSFSNFFELGHLLSGLRSTRTEASLHLLAVYSACDWPSFLVWPDIA